VAAAGAKNKGGYFEVYSLFLILGLLQFFVWWVRLAGEQKITLPVILAGLGFFVLAPCAACVAALFSPADSI
jgi:hypothetical protein